MNVGKAAGDSFAVYNRLDSARARTTLVRYVEDREERVYCPLGSEKDVRNVLRGAICPLMS